ncbi:uncharacterized protein LOC127011642 [Drosophila biarmipes]|uniref:uncharacterized protein LOC127011642 n=1 Tax=Drosophila biarmipes TaxID=125945 RepID=UPI0021CCC06F|nr:uncharacterized protein LOC127011642 [Drosophila biarmipes]
MQFAHLINENGRYATMAAAIGITHKLDPVFKRTLFVIQGPSNDRYLIEDLTDHSVSQRRYNVVSIDHKKPWCALIPDFDTNNESYDFSTEDKLSPGKVDMSKIEQYGWQCQRSTTFAACS